MDEADGPSDSGEKPPDKDKAGVQDDAPQRQIASSFSMAHALSMVRQRQQQQQQAKQEAEVDLLEQKREKARAKRKRRRQNQKLAKSKSKEAEADDVSEDVPDTGNTCDVGDKTKKGPEEGGSSFIDNLKRVCDESDVDPALKLPVKKRLKLELAKNEARLQSEASHDLEETIKSKANSTMAHMKLIPRALMLKKKNV